MNEPRKPGREPDALRNRVQVTIPVKNGEPEHILLGRIYPGSDTEMHLRVSIDGEKYSYMVVPKAWVKSLPEAHE